MIEFITSDACSSPKVQAVVSLDRARTTPQQCAVHLLTNAAPVNLLVYIKSSFSASGMLVHT
jgi:hypothetical protein